jgi:hypothetical protein
MGKEYEQIKFQPGSTIPQAVDVLLKYRKNGRLAVGKFNGVALYSDTVTLASAYQQITGKTKAEFDEHIR